MRCFGTEVISTLDSVVLLTAGAKSKVYAELKHNLIGYDPLIFHIVVRLAMRGLSELNVSCDRVTRPGSDSPSQNQRMVGGARVIYTVTISNKGNGECSSQGRRAGPVPDPPFGLTRGPSHGRTPRGRPALRCPACRRY